MFARLILALLLAAFALPALANGPCHDAPMARMAAAMEHGTRDLPRHDERTTVPHVCIGCIPPASLRAQAFGVPMAPNATERRIVAEAFDPAAGTRPALRPPRIDA